MMAPKSEAMVQMEEEGELTITCILCLANLAYTRFSSEIWFIHILNFAISDDIPVHPQGAAECL